MLFKLDVEQVQTILRGLDQLPHGQVRPLIDHLVTETNAQIASQQKALAEAQLKEAESSREEKE